MMGTLYGCIGLICLPILMLVAMGSGAFTQHAQGQSGSPAPAAPIAGMMFVMGLSLPVLYGMMGFVFGIIGAAIYNLIARWMGGIEVEVEDLP